MKGLNEMDIIDVARTIIGKNGRRVPEYGGISNAWVRGLFPSYYGGVRKNGKTVFHYLNRSWTLPNELTDTYVSPAYYPSVMADMENLCQTITSLHRLRRIQKEIHQMVITSVPEGHLRNLEQHYVADGASRDQIANYLSEVLHGVALQNS